MKYTFVCSWTDAYLIALPLDNQWKSISEEIVEILMFAKFIKHLKVISDNYHHNANE